LIKERFDSLIYLGLQIQPMVMEYKHLIDKQANEMIRKHQNCTNVTVNFRLPSDILIETFLCLGASGTAKCAMVCREWNATSQNSLALWRYFTREDFGINLQQNDGSKNNNIEWSKVYRYLSSQTIIENLKVLPARVIFADDGSSIKGYPAENAFDPQKGAWCTSWGVQRNIDLVVELPTAPCLVTDFFVQNGSHYYTAPLKQALIFASLERPPDLEIGKKFNDEEGMKWVEKLVTLDDEIQIEKWKESNDDDKTIVYKHRRVKRKKCASLDQQQQQKYQPLAAFNFPSNEYDDCVNASFQYNACASPIIARYIHFKLLNSVTNDKHGRLSTNIDILNLGITGIDLPVLPELLHLEKKGQEDERFGRQMAKDPSYKRMHKVIY